MSDSNDAFYREVDEIVRQEQYKKLFARYGMHIAIAAILFIGAVAVWQGWKFYQARLAESDSAYYFDATRKAAQGKLDDALAALGAITYPGYAQLGQLQQAAILGVKGETARAVAAYDAFAANPANDPALADLARIRAGYLLIDTNSPDQLLSRLGRFDKNDARWHNEAREIFALSAYRVKDYDMANRYFSAIQADAKASPGLRQRTQMMLQLIAPNLSDK